ncbi:P-loop NTPase fold protein [uncultured Streptococcus sp.]|uniref:KAP family P-loop NTPase fold protein n=1 Tax=uncultured Streptococcus sp. TaxID=83427 RepID=UPI0025D2A70E|nr:P-loop NTPase fold protein [uncultured Streptococcus sp.]
MTNPIYGTLIDSPAEEDLFNIKNYVDGLTRFISECKTPMTISLQGNWGTGKTSIMKQVESKLDSEKIKSIFFNTWQYSQFNSDNDLTIALITELVTFLASLLPEKAENRELLSKTFGLISNIAIGVTATILENATSGFINLEGVAEKIKNRTNGRFSYEGIISLRELNQSFRDLVKKVIETEEIDRIVFFIDDLDRLHPSRAVEVLEVLKLFLESEYCVFVLAIDYNVVVKGIKNKYNGEIDDEKGDYFFEKLIQVPFTVPIHNYDIENYIKKLLDNLNIVGVVSQNKDDFSSSVLPIILKSVGKHPRNIKRLLNSFSLLLRIQNSADDESKKRLLAVLCLQTSYKEVFFFLSESDADNIKERFNSLKETSESFAEGDIDKPEGFDDFMNEFQKIFENQKKNVLDSEALRLSLNISEAVSSGKKEEDSDSQYIDFWSGFSQYLNNRDNFEFRHSGNKISSKFYRVISTETSKLHCEFRVNKNSIGLVYGDVKDEKLNKFLISKGDEIKSKFIGNIVSIRDWKNDSKNNYNRIPGVTITNNRLGIGYSNYELIYEWFYTTLMTVVKYINELKEN